MRRRRMKRIQYAFMILIVTCATLGFVLMCLNE